MPSWYVQLLGWVTKSLCSPVFAGPVLAFSSSAGPAVCQQVAPVWCSSFSFHSWKLMTFLQLLQQLELLIKQLGPDIKQLEPAIKQLGLIIKQLEFLFLQLDFSTSS
jgi:hypothetical protein